MRVLVTGGLGFIGSSAVKNLLKQGYKVRVLDNLKRGKKNRLSKYKKDFEFINGDVRDFDTVNKCLKNIDSIYHFAFINGTKFFYNIPFEILEVGIKGIMNIIDASKKKNINHLVLASSSEVYQRANIIPTPENIEFKVPDVNNPRFSYGGGKIISELVAVNAFPKYFNKLTIFRPHNVYGPNMGNDHVIPELINKIKNLKNKKELTIQGTGNETRSFIYIDDFIRSLDLCVKYTKKKEIFNLGTSDEIKIIDLSKKILKITNRRNIKIKKTSKLFGSTERRCPDITKIEMLGFKPETSLDDGLKKMVDWYLYKKTNSL